MKLITLDELDDGLWEDLSWQKIMTCVNHQAARYQSKNPWMRSLHYTRIDPTVTTRNSHGELECECPFSDLRVICDDDDNPVNMPRLGAPILNWHVEGE